MTLKQAKFVREYIKNGGNGVRAALTSYATKDYNTANQIAIGNLQSPTVISEIRRNLESIGLSDKDVDESTKILLDAAIANASKTKPADGVAIIRMLNELRDRFPARKHINANLNSELESMSNATVDELKETLRAIQEQNKILLAKIDNAS